MHLQQRRQFAHHPDAAAQHFHILKTLLPFSFFLWTHLVCLLLNTTFCALVCAFNIDVDPDSTVWLRELLREFFVMFSVISF